MLGFYDGVHMKVNGKRYFIQLRVAVHGYDTRALQPMLRVHKESKTLVSCPLCDSTNTYLNTHFKKLAVYEGHRWLLPLSHYLRLYGQSRRCCPQGQYHCSQLLVDNTDLFATHVDIRPRSLIESHQHNSRRDLTSCSPEYAENGSFRQQWLHFREHCLMNPKGDFTWFHSMVRPVLLSEYLYYASCDYRAEHQYRRISNEEYLNRANTAIDTGIHSQGVFGVWVYAKLPYSNVARQVCWDPFHTLLNVAKYTIDTWKGKRTVSKECIAYEKQIGGHPDFYQPNTKKRKLSDEETSEVCKVPYVLRETTRNKIEDCVDLIHIPVGHGEHYQVKKMFNRTGELHGHAKIQVVTVLMEFILWFITQFEPDYPSAYIAFHLMLSSDLQFLQRHSFTKEEVQWLHKLIIETVATHNGLFPPTESKIIWHQLVDIVPFIEFYGPIRGWWTLPMERALSKFKTNVPNGGSSYYITAFRRQMFFEQYRLRQGYAFCADDMGFPERKRGTVLDNPENRGSVFILNKQLVVTDKAIFLRHAVKVDLKLEDGELNSLLLLLVDEVRRLSNYNEDIALRSSCLYRLHESCKTHNRRFRSKIPPSQFLWWMRGVDHVIEVSNLSVLDGDISILPLEAIIEELNCGNIFKSDLRQLKKFWSTKAAFVLPYHKASVFGIAQHARGYAYREDSDPERRGLNVGWNSGDQYYFPIKSCNYLCANLSRNEYSSWFSLVDPILNEEDKTEINAPRTGQFNFFFRVLIRKGDTTDPLIHGIPIGSAVLRNTSRITIRLAARGTSSVIMTKIFSVDATKNESFHHSQRFVPLTLVQATAFGVCFMVDKDGKSFPVKNKLVGKEGNTLKRVLLISLYPSRAASVAFSPHKRKDLYHNASLDD